MKKIAVLLGAGASVPAGYCTTEELTELVLAPEGSVHHTDQELHKSPSITTSIVPLLRKTMCRLRSCAQEYYCQRKEYDRLVNYEDIYYLAAQLEDDQTELQNPAFLPFLQQLKHEIAQWPEYKTWYELRPRPEYRFHELFRQTCSHIETIVINELSKQGNTKDEHLRLIKAIRDADDLTITGIATLAHDIHVETYLQREGMIVADGFGDSVTEHGWPIWENNFPSACGCIPFMKLHGSVNWKSIYIPNKYDENRLTSTAITKVINAGGKTTPKHSSDPWEQWEHLRAELKQYDLPIVLIGTFNKLARYSWKILLDIHYRFRKTLESSDVLVVCGYSFGDKGINGHIVDWHTTGRTLVVIDSNCRRSLIKSARGAAQHSLARESTEFLSKPMESVDSSELMCILRPSLG